MIATSDDLKLAEIAVRRFFGGHCSPTHHGTDDALSDAAFGIAKATMRWELDSEVRQSWTRRNYLLTVATSAVIDGMRKRNGRMKDDKKHSKQRFRTDMVRLDEMHKIGEDIEISQYERLGGSEDLALQTCEDVELLQQLPAREGEAIFRHIILGEPNAMIAKSFNVTESRISQIVQSGLEKLKLQLVTV